MSHGIGRAFWQVVRVRPGTPLLHRWPTYEGGWPYRWSNSVIIRVFARALVLGWWHDADPGTDEVDLLLRAVLGRRLGETVTDVYCSPQTCGVTHVHEEGSEDLVHRG